MMSGRDLTEIAGPERRVRRQRIKKGSRTTFCRIPGAAFTSAIAARALPLELLRDLEESRPASRPVSTVSENPDPRFHWLSHALRKPNTLAIAAHGRHWHFHVSQ